MASVDNILRALGPLTVEVWRCRALARSFRYGVAFAHEAANGPLRRWGRYPVFDIAHAQLGEGTRPEGEPVEDDPRIDEVRHLPPEPHQNAYFILPLQEAEASVSEDGSETSEPYSPTTLREFSEAGNSSQGGPYSGQSPHEESAAQGAVAPNLRALPRLPWASYKAVDGALIVIYLDDE